jgi:hypothetical protein
VENNLKSVLIIAEIAVIAVIVIFLGMFLWQNTGIGSIDLNLQIVFVGLLVLTIVFVANYLINKRW